MSIHAVSLLMEAIFLKARALNDLGKFAEAARTCNSILDMVESAAPNGLPTIFRRGCRLQDIVCKSVELLPELWKMADNSHGAISSYRRALLGKWNLDPLSIGKIRKEFAIFLLYGGCDSSPPNQHSQMDNYFAPKNNLEEAIILLMLLLSDFNEKKAEWDPSIIEHLTFALSISGQLKPLANRFEELLPGILDRNERYYKLGLCYLGEGDILTALNLLKKIFSDREGPNSVKALLLASKICGENSAYAEEGASFSHRTLTTLDGRCESLQSVAYFLLGISLSAQARFSASDSERIAKEDEALEALENAVKFMQVTDCGVIYHLSLENAKQRKLDVALSYAKQLLKLEAGSNVNSWILVARILSAQKRFVDAETIVNAAIDQTGKWSQGELLRTKARIQIARGQLQKAVETYTNLLAVIRLRNKNLVFQTKSSKIAEVDRKLEMGAWYDLATVYTSMSNWRDAEVCISKLKAISPYSALGWHATGQLQEAKGLHKESLTSYSKALDLEPTHVPSLVSTAIVLRHCGDRPFAAVRSFLTEALRLDRTNHVAWLNLGLLYEAEGASAVEAAGFQAAAVLEESAPVEPFL
ncbi:protein NPGR2 [Phalaenopsis equestris]|uniref:protein NPGR2 n=1 Tax=Phalaenopsis equestris TaxID=78828 RepID=UPI0009E1A7E3|nr:protein NPGR2 [Phalaenopsis equestris]